MVHLWSLPYILDTTLSPSNQITVFLMELTNIPAQPLLMDCV